LVEARSDFVERFRSRLYIKNCLARKALAEFFGTFLLVFIGLCVNAQTLLGGGKVNSFIQVNIGWGFAVTFGVLVAAKTSGGHLNPAVTAMMLAFGQICPLTAVVYMVAQTVGAFFGAAATYLFYWESIRHYINLPTFTDVYFATANTATIFATGVESISPNVMEKLSWLTVFMDQFVGAGLFCLIIAAVVDKRNEIPSHLHALLFGFAIMMIGCAFGLHIGYPVNPARDLGPRLFAFLIYGSLVFTSNPFYFLAPVLGPIAGGIACGWIYYGFAGYQIGDEHSHHHHNRHAEVAHNGEDQPLHPGGRVEKVVP